MLKNLYLNHYVVSGDQIKYSYESIDSVCLLYKNKFLRYDAEVISKNEREKRRLNKVISKRFTHFVAFNKTNMCFYQKLNKECTQLKYHCTAPYFIGEEEVIDVLDEGMRLITINVKASNIFEYYEKDDEEKEVYLSSLY